MGIDRFELLELRHDDGIQTYHARELATARPLQVHLFAEGQTRDTLGFMSRLAYLPDDERRRIVERGVYQGIPYLVTERLAGYASVREWIDKKSAPTLDQQFAALFQPEPEPAAMSEEPDPVALPPIRSHVDSPARSKVASVAGLVLGMGAALIFLVLLIAFIAFRPHQL